MVEWCDDERDTKSSYGSYNDIDASNDGMSVREVIQGVFKNSNESLYNMGFNEAVYKEIKYEMAAREDPVIEERSTLGNDEEDEKNADLLLSKKFADS
jgi:hypothetical protein